MDEKEFRYNNFNDNKFQHLFLIQIIMSQGSKSINRIIRSPNNKVSGYSSQRSPQTSRRRPIFSQQKHETAKKRGRQSQRVDEFKIEAANFLQKMLIRVESKNKFLKQIQEENQKIKRQNRELQDQNKQIIKKLAVHAGVDRLRQKNSQYRAKLLKAEALLYQLRRSSKHPIKGIDQLINSIHL